ncbi:MAG TPA: alpha-2-macroglobulin family protein, partial [Candidatus Baltobacteraceae bacterium]|nr:alpha-2-macroglobulin family protein [Candidatus Baltobacteraceae bacterium]
TAVRLPSVTTDRYGMFTLPYTFSKTQALGYYNVAATGPNGNVITGDLRVAEFKPPNFKLDLSLSAPSAIAGGSVLATANAAYLFGAPLQGGKAHAYVTRSLAQVAPAGWDDFSFGRQWFWPEQPPEIPSDVVQRDLPLDAAGQAQLGVTVPAAGTELPAPMTYRVDVDATDVSNLSVSGSQSFLALPADGVIGLASDTVGAAKVAMPVRVIVTDAQGKAIPGRGVHLNLDKMTYTSATQAEEGGENAEQSVRYDSVGTADVTSSAQAVTATLVPPEAGSYRVRATFSGSSEVAAATDIQVFAYGPNAADFGQTDKTSVRITLDKKKYRVGDLATALVGSPFDHSDVYLSVIRNGVIYKTVLHDTAGAPHVSFRVTPDMVPNAALEAVVVRRGPKLASVKPGSLDSLSRVGIAGFDIDMSDRYLRVGIVPQKTRLAPGATQQLQFTLRDTRGRGLRGKIVAMAVNEAVLQLSGYRLPDLVQTIFADQPISTRFADNRENVTLRTAQAPVEKGFGFGGGFLEGAAGTRVRTNFLPLAYYGAITTDASGNASASFAVPDDLTTWRVMAVAIAQDDAHFGTADATFVSTLPLMANPLLPQFARPGDEMDVGASVMNQTGAAGALDVRGTLAGALRFANGLAVQQTRTQAPGIAAYRFPVTVGTPAPSTVAFRAGLGSASDAFSVPFEVTDRNVTESVIESGATSRTADIPIAFDRPGTLSVTVANSVVPQFAVPAARALQNEGVGISDEYASRIVIAASLRSLEAAYHLRFDVDAAKLAQTNVRDLVALQRGDGGFTTFAGGRQSDAFGSAFALEALAYAAADGVTVDSSVLASAKRFAADALANPSRFTWCNTALCKAQMRFSMLWSLAAA